MGAYGDPCEYVNVCDPGLVCLASDHVPVCTEDMPGCCTPLCDLLAPECPMDTLCSPWFSEDAEIPAGLENVGACVDPTAV
jgi:hypothetical protein